MTESVPVHSRHPGLAVSGPIGSRRDPRRKTLPSGGPQRRVGTRRDSDCDSVAPTLINGLNIRIINPTTVELLRQLTLNPDRDYQPQPRT